MCVLIFWNRSKVTENFLKNMITVDKSCIFKYDPETKRESKEWHTSASPRPKKLEGASQK